MKILVLNPPFKTEYGKFSTQSRCPSISKGGTIYFPYFLAHTVGVLEQEGYDVDFIDACADKLKRMDVLLMVRKEPKLIVIGTTTPSINEDIETAKVLKKKFPDAFIVMVGTHVSFLPDEVLQSDAVDAVARKEYDYTIRDLAKIIDIGGDLDKVMGLSYRVGSMSFTKHNKDREPIKNLDKLPFVSKVYRDHLNIDNYFFAASDYPLVQILSARGCTWGNCTFCMTPAFEGKYRQRSIKNFVDELQWISRYLPEVKEIGIEDGCFGPNERIREICKEIIFRNMNIKWYCNVRVSLDLETMQYMKKAGCHLITVGFESSSPEILKNIKKGITVEQMKQFTINAKKTGLLVHGCFMAGNQGESYETLRNNLELAKELRCDTMQFFPLMVYPGTQSYRWARKNNLIIEHNWGDWVREDGSYSCVISLPNLSKEEIVKISNDSVREYHTRPAYILYKFLRVLTHPDEFTRTYKGFKSFIKNVIIKNE